MQINEISTTIIIVISILITTSGIGTLSSLVFAQNDSETDLGNMTLTNSSENLVDISGLEAPQRPQGPIPSAPERQPQGPLSPPTVSEQQPQPLLPPQQSPSEQPSGEPTIR